VKNKQFFKKFTKIFDSYVQTVKTKVILENSIDKNAAL